MSELDIKESVRERYAARASAVSGARSAAVLSATTARRRVRR